MKKVFFITGGKQHEAGTRDFSAHGVFVQANGPSLGQRLELLVVEDSVCLTLPGEIVCIRSDGFGMAFDALSPDVVGELTTYLRSSQGVPPDRQERCSASTGFLRVSQVEGVRWCPPVSGENLHEWKPPEGFLVLAAPDQTAVVTPPAETRCPGTLSLSLEPLSRADARGAEDG